MNEPAADIRMPDPAETRVQLQRILTSGTFAGAPVLSGFLRHVVEHRMRADGGSLKEYSIAVEVLGRSQDFDPQVDTIVRVHARRLRDRLAKYYQGDGRCDPILITMPKGRYEVEFLVRADVVEDSADRTLGRSQVGPIADAHVGAIRFRAAALPAPRTPLIGRAAELIQLHALMSGSQRLITLTGAGGSGKTRLALELGHAVKQDFGGGVIFVGLAAVVDIDTLELAIARALGVNLVERMPVADAICRHVQSQATAPMLLVLDNFEHLLQSASLVGSLLDACGPLKMLVTSRVPLHVYGEYEFPVTPLAVPKLDPLPPTHELGEVPSVNLFLQRVAAVNLGFRLSEDNAAAVAEVCRCLDGLPLATELAAAQCGNRTIQQLLSSPATHLDLPADHAVDAPDRHRTLRKTIDWSHAILAKPEQVLFRRLAVFPGGFTLEAAQAVADDQGDLTISVESGLARLVDSSLLYRVPDAAESRYAMLETIRSYGAERLAASHEQHRISRVHAAYCLVLAEEGNGQLSHEAREAWLRRCDLEQDNFRVAFAGMLERGEASWAMRMAQAVHGYWERRECLVEGLRELIAVLERFGPDEDPERWGCVASYASKTEDMLGDHASAQARYRQVIAMQHGIGNHQGEVSARNALGVSFSFSGDHDQALACFESSLEICRQIGQSAEVAAALSNLANIVLATGDHARARELFEESLAMFRLQRDPLPVAWCFNHLGDVAMVEGQHERARDLYQQAADAFLQLGELWGVARSWTDLGYLALKQDHLDDAAGLFADALRIFRKVGHRRGVVAVIEGCAKLAARRRRFDQALVLAGAADAVRASLKMAAHTGQQATMDEALDPARVALGATQSRDCHARGLAMDPQAAMDHVLASVSHANSQAGRQT